ncbi:CopD family protein [Kitasatospora acidiphila]|uniref:CopD family protein n=1 Tax=Kitasatospora acidiphila TaxID=2567942 RepID=A0A540WE92_9ACTN|nr:CopD family protein [Kitasatospora acidiphila]
MSWRHVGAIDQLWTTGYGLALLVKVILVLGLITAGAVNQLWLMPRIAQARRTADTTSLLRLTLRHFPKGRLVRGRPRPCRTRGHTLPQRLGPHRGPQPAGRLLSRRLHRRRSPRHRPGRLPLRNGQGIRRPRTPTSPRCRALSRRRSPWRSRTAGRQRSVPRRSRGRPPVSRGWRPRRR